MARRKMSLPPDEVLFLRSLSGKILRARVSELFYLGWSLAAIAEAFDPPRARATIRSWVTPSSTPYPSRPTPSSSSLSSSSSSLPITAAENSSSPAPSPAPSPALTLSPKPREERRIYDPRSPQLSIAAARKIADLAPVARQHRAGAAPTGRYAVANDELNRLCRLHFERGASIRELALAAGVSYKAMERRVRA